MSVLEADNPEIPAGAYRTHAQPRKLSVVEIAQSAVTEAFHKPLEGELHEPPTEAVPLTPKGEVIDHDRRQRIQIAQAKVDAAYLEASPSGTLQLNNLLERAA